MTNIKVNISRSPRIITNQSNLVSVSLSNLIDVNATNRQDGSVLVYDDVTEKYVATLTLDSQIIDGGVF